MKKKITVELIVLKYIMVYTFETLKWDNIYLLELTTGNIY